MLRVDKRKIEIELKDLKEELSKASYWQMDIIKKKIILLKKKYEDSIRHLKVDVPNIFSGPFFLINIKDLKNLHAAIRELTELETNLELLFRKKVARELSIPVAFLSPKWNVMSNPIIDFATGETWDLSEVKEAKILAKNQVVNRALKNCYESFEKNKGFTKEGIADMFCSIDSLLLGSAVITRNGHTYNAKSIEGWFKKSKIDPLQNNEEKGTSTCKNIAMQLLVEEFLPLMKHLEKIESLSIRLQKLKKPLPLITSDLAKDKFLDELLTAQLELNSAITYLVNNKYFCHEANEKIEQSKKLVNGFSALHSKINAAPLKKPTEVEQKPLVDTPTPVIENKLKIFKK